VAGRARARPHGIDGLIGSQRSRTLVVLGGGPAQQPAIAAARRLGVRTIVCDEVRGRGDVHVSSEDAAAVAELLARAGGAIAPGTDWPVRVAAEACAAAGIPHPLDPATAVLATDKLLQRARLAEAGVPQPAFSDAEPPAYPCVVKPADRQGQRGISVVASADALPAALERARSASRSGRATVEQLVAGPEVTVNGFSARGEFTAVAVTDREHFPDVFGVCRRHVLPALAGAADAAAAAGAAVRALGIEEGPSYVQLVLSAGGPRVIEVAARLGGGFDSELIRAALGIDLAGAAVLAALGRPVEPEALAPRTPAQAGVIEFLRAPPGRLGRVSGPSEACFYDSPGHVYPPLRTGPDRAGHVLVVAADRERALARAAAAVAAVRFEPA
jgi:biotin carboxylase